MTDAERDRKAPAVDPQAGAEVLFWRVYVEDEVVGQDLRTVLSHYVRVKVFNDRGRDALKTVDLAYGGDNEVVDIAGRTLKADGAIVELRKDAIMVRDIVKAGGRKVKAKSFAMPAVEPGAIIEYRYREVRNNQVADYIRLQLQRDLPVQNVEYHVKPMEELGRLGFGMQMLTLNAKLPPMTKDKEGYSVFSMSNVPAFKEEPQMPSEARVRPWVLIYYLRDVKTPDKFWPEYAKRIFEERKPQMKANGDVQAAAQSAIEGATDPEEKLKRLATFCRTQIKNLYDDDVTEEQRKKAKDNNSPGDTLKHRMGWGTDINLLFAAMASSAGFDVRYAKLSDRSDYPFDRRWPNGYLLNTYDIAVKVNGTWKFYDVAQRHLPFGMIPWQEEGAEALICDGKNPEFVRTGWSDPARSAVVRHGTFSLNDEGALEGDVALSYTGHVAQWRRSAKQEESESQREEDIRDMVRDQFSNAEITAIKIENIKDPEQPLIYRYHVKVPGYAQKTGKRMFVQPAFFQYGKPSRFEASERKYDIHFDYPIFEDDKVVIKAPAGVSIENGESPEPLSFGKTGGYKVELRASAAGDLIYTREMRFGVDHLLVVPVVNYPLLKQVFDAIQKRDQHAVTFRMPSKVAQ